MLKISGVAAIVFAALVWVAIGFSWLVLDYEGRTSKNSPTRMRSPMRSPLITPESQKANLEKFRIDNGRLISSQLVEVETAPQISRGKKRK